MTRNAAARRRWERLGDAGLAVAAVLGAVCIVLAVAAAVFDVRIVMFRTGSMSPTFSRVIAHGVIDAVGTEVFRPSPGGDPNSYSTLIFRDGTLATTKALPVASK